MEYTLLSGDDSINTCDVESLRDLYEDLLLLRFRRHGTLTYDTLAVSRSSLKRFVKKETKSGKDINNLRVATASCEGGNVRNFILTMRVWRESILPHSKRLRSLYCKTFPETKDTTALYRDFQIQELNQELPDLSQRLQYWVADLLKLKTNRKNKRLRERLEMPASEDIPAYVSPFYFSSIEAKFILSQTLPCGKSCGDEWVDVIEQKVAAGLMPCTSHHLAPVIIEAFNLKESFHMDIEFRRKHERWIEDHQVTRHPTN